MANIRKPIRVIQYGMGPIGCAAVRAMLTRKQLELVAAVDIDPQKIGRDVAEVAAAQRRLGIAVLPTLADALKQTSADVVLHTTGSFLDSVTPQLTEILGMGLDVVSSTEELSYPWADHAQYADAIQRAALQAGKTALGTGVNPGFLMDTLPLALTALCLEVERISVARVIDAARRRLPFQAKIGVGMTREQFEAEVSSGRMGHVGLRESTAMLCESFGHSVDSVRESIEPVLAEADMQSGGTTVSRGRVIGVHQTLAAVCAGTEFVSFTFHAALEAADEADHIEIAGQPPLRIDLHGTNGDIATVAILVNAIERVVAAAPGLKTMRDLPPVFRW